MNKEHHHHLQINCTNMLSTSPLASHISASSSGHEDSLVPIPPMAETPVVYKQERLSVPQEVLASSNEFSEFELSLSPRSACAAIEGHKPNKEQLAYIARGLAGVARKNEANTKANQQQLALLQERSITLAKREADAAHMEETY